MLITFLTEHAAYRAILSLLANQIDLLFFVPFHLVATNETRKPSNESEEKREEAKQCAVCWKTSIGRKRGERGTIRVGFEIKLFIPDTVRYWDGRS